jgi:hypothetical protein
MTETPSQEEQKKAILDAYRRSFTDPAAAGNRVAFVARQVGMSVHTLYARIDALGIRQVVKSMRDEAKRRGLTRRRDAGGDHAGYGGDFTCGNCGEAGHRSHQCDKPKRQKAG